jgi:hypothetical protein
MKTTKKTVARLLPLLALLSLLPFATCSCEDAGDEPAGPTGPSSQYNPEMDYAGAKLVVKAEPGVVGPGDFFDLIATFTDAEGRPVSGVPLTAQVEAGGVGAENFTFTTNPTMTNQQGRASIRVDISLTCPSGSYSFIVSSTMPGPRALGQSGITVKGSTSETISTPAAPIGSTFPPEGVETTYRAEGARSSLRHEVEYLFDWGDDTSSSWVPADSAGEAFDKHAYTYTCGDNKFLITVKARCKEHPEVVSPTSPPLTVSVTLVCAP